MRDSDEKGFLLQSKVENFKKKFPFFIMDIKIFIDKLNKIKG